MKIVHIAAHLGGGVGKALSDLVIQSKKSGTGYEHVILCLEKPIKSQSMELIEKSGGIVIVNPGINELRSYIHEADIVHLDWWDHPATIECLCRLSDIPMRLLVWSHVSGLHTPIIPEKLIESSLYFVFTSECSFRNEKLRSIINKKRGNISAINSNGGFLELDGVYCSQADELCCGYIGSFNFSKLNPNYVDYLSKISLPDLHVKMIGDPCNAEQLLSQCRNTGRNNLLEFTGFVPEISKELSTINVLIYLLNPNHYGTTENALLEAMAIGIVPVVLNNPAESCIVDNGNTGYIVSSADELNNVICMLANNPELRRKIGRRAAQEVRRRYTAENMESSMNECYNKIINLEKIRIDFSSIFGSNPHEWFLSSQEQCNIFLNDGKISNIVNTEMYELFEETKGSVFHFSRFFPEDHILKMWADNLRNMQKDAE